MILRISTVERSRTCARRWRLVMLPYFVLLLACSLTAQVAPPLKYKVLKSGKPQQTVAALNALAEQGYRLILPGQVFILRFEATPPDTYRYKPVDFKDGPVQFVNWLNEQGARGYRRVPWPGADVMGKEPHPRNYEYASPSPHSFHFGGAKTDELSSLVSQGYHPVGLAWFSLHIGSPWRELFFEREMGVKSRKSSTTTESSLTARPAQWRTSDSRVRMRWRRGQTKESQPMLPAPEPSPPTGISSHCGKTLIRTSPS